MAKYHMPKYQMTKYQTVDGDQTIMVRVPFGFIEHLTLGMRQTSAICSPCPLLALP